MNLCYNEFGDSMKLEGKTKKWEVIPCHKFWLRLKGNMGKKEIASILLFPRCNSIHTFFMRSKIDVVMLDKENQVLYVSNYLPPYQILFPKKNVYATLEFPPGENIYQKGDFISYQK